MSALIKQDIHLTYEDYCQLDTDQRMEIINGVPIVMQAPSIAHQTVVINLSFEFKSYFKGKTCRPFVAPVDVRINYDQRDDKIVQPDLLVVCDPRTLEDGQALKGAPDLIVEIVSPSSAKYDRVTKFNLYQEAGVKEYWLVDTVNQIVEVFVLENERYVAFDRNEEVVKSALFPDLMVTYEAIFDGIK